MPKKEQLRPKCQSCSVVTSDLSAAGWQGRYDSGQTGWDRGEPNPMLNRWLMSQHLEPCRILVPGCGRGHEVMALAQAGFEVTAIDFASAAVDALQVELQRQSLSANVVHMDLFAYCPAGEFDAVYEQTCLCAIDPSQWETYQQLLSCWLRPGGSLFAMFMQTDRPEGPPFACHPTTMQKLFSSPIWNWASEPEKVSHPAGMHELGCILTREEAES